MTSIDTVVYHFPCSDGHAAAWVVRLKYPNAKFVGCKAGCAPTVELGKFIVFVDLTPPADFIHRCLNDGKKVSILDHHESAEKILFKFEQDSNFGYTLDKTRSGCQLAWDYFNTTQSIRPWFIDYIADRDLWKFELPDSKEINAGLHYTDDFTFERLDRLYSEEKEMSMKRMKEIGKVIIDLQSSEIDSAKRRAVRAKFMWKNEILYIWIVGNASKLRSEIGAALVQTPFEDGTFPAFSATYEYDLKSDEWWISLRGGDNSPNLSDITMSLGGGGHPKAAGFTIKPGKTLKDIFII